MPNRSWFDRRWDFGNIEEPYATTKNRLSAAIPELRSLTADIPLDRLIWRPGGKWSIKEHMGHLILLESLWRARFGDILQNKEEMTITDIQNRATWDGGFNDYELNDLLGRFAEERNTTLQLLGSLGEPDHSKSSRHPRLGQLFRIVDQAFFVAEHDSHHIERIREIKTSADGSDIREIKITAD